MFIVFTLIIALIIYIYWGQQDDFCFAVIFLLLSAVLYILSQDHKQHFFSWIEKFEEQPKSQAGAAPGGAAGVPVTLPLDLPAFKKLSTLRDDTFKILQPKFENLVAAFKGNAKVEDEQKYDSNGNEVQEEKPDEVPVDSGAESEIRQVNKFLKDLKKYEPAYYHSLFSLATTGKVDPSIQEEYPL
jgi:type IV secretory pathway VirB3-like protein